MDGLAPAQLWSTKEDIAAAHGRFVAAIPGWKPPHAYGVGLVQPDDTVFPVVNVGTAHFLPAVVLAMVCGHSRGTAVYLLSAERLGEVIALLAPAEACRDYEHPNLRAWRGIRETIEETGGHAVAVFVGDQSDPVTDIHDGRFRARLYDMISAGR
jgi:hypothetical protein